MDGAHGGDQGHRFVIKGQRLRRADLKLYVWALLCCHGDFDLILGSVDADCFDESRCECRRTLTAAAADVQHQDEHR